MYDKAKNLLHCFTGETQEVEEEAGGDCTSGGGVLAIRGIDI